jgi:galactokinase
MCTSAPGVLQLLSRSAAYTPAHVFPAAIVARSSVYTQLLRAACTKLASTELQHQQNTIAAAVPV